MDCKSLQLLYNCVNRCSNAGSSNQHSREKVGKNTFNNNISTFPFALDSNVEHDCKRAYLSILNLVIAYEQK